MAPWVRTLPAWTTFERWAVEGGNPNFGFGFCLTSRLLDGWHEVASWPLLRTISGGTLEACVPRRTQAQEGRRLENYRPCDTFWVQAGYKELEA